MSALLTWTLLVLTPTAVAALRGAGRYAGGLRQAELHRQRSRRIAALLVMFVPQIWFYGLAVVSAGVLQAHQRFLAAALARCCPASS